MARTLIHPAAGEYLRRIGRNIQVLQQTGVEAGLPEQFAEAEQIGKLMAALVHSEAKLEKTLPAGEPEEIREAQLELRRIVDRLEKLIDDELWPLPKYREMLFIY